MRFDLILFVLFLGLASSASAASSFILLAMVGEINRRRDDHSQIPYFWFSWWTVWREYRLLYPDGRYSRALIVVTCLAFVFAVACFYQLFGVHPKYSLPSR
jgi:Kef-type K+ transport system membrane component KefB